MSQHRSLIGVVGGTGALGSALAKRWARAGHTVIIGSRAADKAQALADAWTAKERLSVSGASNSEAAARAEIVVVTVPWSAQEATLSEIRETAKGKIVVDTTVPVVPPKLMQEIGRAHV